MNIYDLIIVQPIFNALLAIYSLIPGGDFGIALIIFTVIVRFILYPLVKRQLHQTRMMRKLQPQLKRIKERTKGDKQAEALQMMELYKRHGVSPFRSMGILLIQLPIFIGLYHVVQIFTLHPDQVERFTYGALRHIPAVENLIAHPESLNLKFLGLVDLSKSVMGGGGIFLLILAALAAVTQYIMTKQTTPTTGSKKTFGSIMRDAASGKQVDQSEINGIVMQNMMKIMPVFMFVIMISVPGALALYYGVSNMVAVAQQSYLLRRDEEELEELADEVDQPSSTTKSSETRAKNAKKANVTRITAKDSKSKKRR